MDMKRIMFKLEIRQLLKTITKLLNVIGSPD